MFQYSKRSLPVTVGRDCAGVVAAVGNAVRGVEVGDEVWLVVPFWAQGTMAQRLAVDGRRVGKKPRGVGYEAACSLPYAGTLALNALRAAQLNCKTSPGKRLHTATKFIIISNGDKKIFGCNRSRNRPAT